MYNFGIFTASALFLLLSQHLSLFALDIESAYESPCFEVKESVALDLTWVTSQQLWYYPLMSRLDLYIFATDISGQDVREHELYYELCPSFVLEPGAFLMEAFGGKKSTYGIKQIEGMGEYDFFLEGGTPEEGGHCYTTLTDNKTFSVNVCCQNFGQMSWAVQSVMKLLPEDTTEQIYDHVESLGFNRQYFTQIRYEQCD